MKRREFMAGALGAAGALGLVGCKQKGRADRQQKPPPEAQSPYSKYESQIRARLKGLTIDGQEVAKFAKAWESQKGPFKGNAARLAELFLLSSDFFQTGEDSARAPKFFMIYDPYLSPCYNPLRDLKT
jgi:hypothetical protein